MAVGTLLEHIDDAPAEDRARALGGLLHEAVHEPVGEVHGRKALDAAADGDRRHSREIQGGRAGDELRGFPDLGIEQLNLIAAELVCIEYVFYI